MTSCEFRFHSQTQTGLRGGVNQDAVLVHPPSFFGVADGVGGGAYGEVASRTALDCTVRIPLADTAAMTTGLETLDSAVAAAIAEQSSKPGATMLAALWLGSGKGVTAHCGDCRIYRMRRGLKGKYYLAALTMDHTYSNLSLTPPPQGHPDDPALMLGLGADTCVTVQEIKIQKNDIFLLCSDGLHRFVSDQSILKIISDMLDNEKSMEAICQRLTERAIHAGSYDDISILLIDSGNRQPKKNIFVTLAEGLSPLSRLFAVCGGLMQLGADLAGG